MKILSAAEMRAADQATFDRIGVPSRAVMESAGRAVAEFALARFAGAARRGILIFTGPGNNGGDGFVAARVLANLGVRVAVVSVVPVENLKGDAGSAARAYLASGFQVEELEEAGWARTAERLSTRGYGLCLDALFGTGLNKPVTFLAAATISWMNASKLPVIAVDIPSGVDSDTGAVHGVGVRAAATITLQTLKLGHVLEPGCELCGRVSVADIGIGPQLREIEGVRRELITAERVLGIIEHSPLLIPEAHKGRRGHVLVVGGSAGKLGAPHLSAQAAILSGAGLVTMALPESGAKEIAPTLKELMCTGLPEEGGAFGAAAGPALIAAASGMDALVIGPGFGTGPGAAELLRIALTTESVRSLPMVIDADALNVLAEHPELLLLLGPNCVLTPHPGEMARLVRRGIPDVQARRLESAQELSSKYRCVVVLKGARTVIAAPEGALFVNPAATAVLGTAGSGDSLAGVIGAFLAQGLSREEASCAAVYAHGAAGEMLEHTDQRVFGVLASTITEQVPRVLNTLLAAGPRLRASKSVRDVLPALAWLGA